MITDYMHPTPLHHIYLIIAAMTLYCELYVRIYINILDNCLQLHSVTYTIQ